MMNARILIPLLLLTASPALAQEVGVKPFNEGPGRASVSDFWQAMKQGQTGRPSSSSVTADYLMHPPLPGCADGRPCSEKSVGFALPIHASMSPPLVSVGTGPEKDAIALLGGFAALGLLIVLRLLVRLGRPDAADHHALGHGD